MRIAIIGASGRSGKAAVAHALGAGHEVIAVVRMAASAPAGTTVRVADARDVAAGAYVAGDDPISRFIAKPIVARAFKATADTRVMETVIRASDTKWTLLRPSRLIPGDGNASYRRKIDKAIWWHYATKFDTVGRAAVDALTTPAWVGHAIFFTE